MKNWKKALAICLIIIGSMIILGYLVISNIFSSSTFGSLDQKDYQNFSNLGDRLFLLYDGGYIGDSESITSCDYEDKPKLEEALSKYKSKIVRVHFVDKNVILLSFGAVFQSVDGIAIRRNNTELKTTYKNTGFDTGTLRYTQLIPNVYHFTAGL